ncbi:MAG: DHH family phosphoesterase, partial [Eubacterium sp.]|nr:DHH family phosphoesterase [Eubacterium sp.]
MKKVWKQRTGPADYRKLGQELGVSPVVARCMRNRNKADLDNLITVEQMSHYLNDTLADLHDPRLMKGAAEAVAMLKAIAGVPGATGAQGAMAADAAETQEPAATVGVEAPKPGATVAIASDYDCDGICSGLVLKMGLRAVGISAEIYTPDRMKEGYGLNRRIVDDAVADGHTVLMTCDNGIAAVDGVTYAKEKGMTVIVTDHHEPQEELPPADVIVDPKQDGETYPFTGLCGAGVAYKLMSYLFAEVCADGSAAAVDGGAPGASVGAADGGAPGASAGAADGGAPGASAGAVDAGASGAGVGAAEMRRLLEHDLLELTAIATVADVMELIDENRILVRHGLLSLQHTSNAGLSSLLKKLRLADKPLDGTDIAFRIGPTMNVAGRIAQVSDTFALLEETDPIKADRMAEALVELNEKRKQMTEEGMEKALAYMREAYPNLDRDEMDDVLVIALTGVHESLAGLIAGRIKERFNHPTIVFTEALSAELDITKTASVDDENGTDEGANGATEDTSVGAVDAAGCVDDANSQLLRGSGRSIAAYDMFEHLMACKDLTEKFGGHKMAAGLTIKKEHLDELRTRLNRDSGLCAEDFVPELLIDLEVPISYVSESLISDLDRMKPFGVANPKPIFAQR